jgi:GNAT superfamily N-acetyltransferase
MSLYLTVSLNSEHKKEIFKSKNHILNIYLQKQAKQDVKRKLTACFVIVEENKIKGFYTLSNAGIDRVYLPVEIEKKLPKSYINLPVTLLGRLAVDLNYAGQGLGELLLMDALKRSYDVSIKSIGSMAVIVDPIDNNAISFYKKYGFIELPDSGKMFLPMTTISKLFKL